MTAESVEPKNRPGRLWAILPLLVFAALAAIFFVQLMSGRDSSTVPSALIGEPAPQTNLPPLEGSFLPGIDSDALQGKMTLVNVWASWCAPCRQEHSLLMHIAGDERIMVAGLNYKDKPAQALDFLGELGNPYDAIGVDRNGRTAIDWGVYGVPETFLVGKDGRILYKHVGPLTRQVVQREILPRAAEALAAPQS